METIYKGDLCSARGRRNAWIDALFVDHAIIRIVWTNFHPVQQGILYRSNHPTPANLLRFTRKVGLRTIINLRGLTGNGSDALSREASQKLGLTLVDLPMSSRLAPTRAWIKTLYDVYGSMETPALVHCKSGSDRAGFAAAIFMLMNGYGCDEAQKQLSIRFGHLKRSRAGILDKFIDSWQMAEHVKKDFLLWVLEDYDAEALTAAFKVNSISGMVNDMILRRE